MAKIDSISKTFDPNEAEPRLYNQWNEKGYFKPDPDTSKEAFSIVMPPPNITGQLHMGHALDNTLQDILVRYKRMRGYSTLWVPGTDHASIATEAKIVEAMRKEGIFKEDIGRENWTGKRSTAEGSLSSLRRSVHPVTGAMSVSRWMRDVQKLLRKSS